MLGLQGGGSVKVRNLTALTLTQGLRAQSPPELEKPELPPAASKLLVRKGINPSKQRRGKSGEIPRRR